MHAIRLHGVEDARFDDVVEPELRQGTVKVKVAWAGICGSDLSLYQHAPVPLDYANPIMGEIGPKTLGHEFSGTVTEVAADVNGIEVGDLVAVQPNFADGTCPACVRGEPNLCRNFAFIGIHGWGGGFSDYVVVPADHAFVLPEGISLEVGALVESLSVAWHAVKKSGATVGSTALVVGAGPIGLGLLLCLKAIGAEQVIVSELSSSRKELARTFGGDVVDPREVDLEAYVRSVSAGGVDVSFDASGVGKPTLQAALNSLRPGGTSVIVAEFHGEVPIDPNLFLLGERALVGSFAYTAEDFSEVIAAIADGRMSPAPLITSKIALADSVERGIEHLLREGRSTEVKILVSPALLRTEH
jgi:(R,R)-butanediol dehydrogenase / meso-butanediol dehydrogenase / diacetyl reductase